MPISFIEKTVEYCTVNKLFFCFVLGLLFVCQFITDYFDSVIIGPIIIAIIMMGYGLQVTQDIINDGKRLPKIMPRKVISFGLKGYFIFIFYVMIQAFLLAIVSVNLNFPEFELEEFIINYNDTLRLFMTHDPVNCAIFVISGFVIVYVTSFFMELALARLADGGKLLNAFNFPRIKHAVDIIGWKNYALDYTKIILSIVILTHLLHYRVPFQLIDSIFDTILSFLIFIIQYIGIGEAYKAYVDNKKRKELE